MKITPAALCATALACALTLSACSTDDKDATPATSAAGTTTATATTTTTTPAAMAQLPTPEELNAVLERATDPNIPTAEKTNTVQDGESAPELFDTMTLSKQESGATFQVVPPLLPGYTPNSVLATVSFTLPDRPAQTADNVEFVYEDGVWKLSRSWACTLITNTVTPDQVPAMCQAEAVPVPGAPAAGAPAEGEQPAADAPAEGEQPAN